MKPTWTNLFAGIIIAALLVVISPTLYTTTTWLGITVYLLGAFLGLLVLVGCIIRLISSRQD